MPPPLFAKESKAEIFRVLDITEKLILSYFNADNINIASFGNLLPQVHWHIMARFGFGGITTIHQKVKSLFEVPCIV
jgi:diadenosine tetraphosphate (Ap4A) HIT family hydrolase